MMDPNISGYINRKTGSGTKYNYELKPLIENFSFLDFISNALKNREVGNDFGAFLVLTNKQYILGYNAGFGVGTHIASFARTYNDINNRGKVENDLEAIRLSTKCQKEYITARIMYECVGENENKIPVYSGSISFSIKSLPISPKQFEVFKKFYENYNREIELVVKKCSINNFCVWFTYDTESSKFNVDKSCNLDNLYKFLESQIDYDKVVDDEDEVLVGVGIDETLSRRSLG